MDKKTKKDDKKTKSSPDNEVDVSNDNTSKDDVAKRCLGLAIEQVPADSSEVSNYEIKTQLIKKLDEQQKRSDEHLGVVQRLEEQLKETNEKLEKRLEEQRKEQEKLMKKFDVLLKHLKVEPVTDEQ